METTLEDLLFFVEVALDGMATIVTDLGDDLANRAPDIAGANSPFVILTHCLGVMAYWGGQVIAGRDVRRDRPSEFTASGPVEPLLAKVAEAKRQLREDLDVVPLDGDAREPPQRAFGPERPAFKAATAAIHILEELAQHHGQMEITRDLLASQSEDHAG